MRASDVLVGERFEKTGYSVGMEYESVLGGVQFVGFLVAFVYLKGMNTGLLIGGAALYIGVSVGGMILVGVSIRRGWVSYPRTAVE